MPTRHDRASDVSVSRKRSESAPQTGLRCCKSSCAGFTARVEVAISTIQISVGLVPVDRTHPAPKKKSIHQLDRGKAVRCSAMVRLHDLDPSGHRTSSLLRLRCFGVGQESLPLRHSERTHSVRAPPRLVRMPIEGQGWSTCRRKRCSAYRAQRTTRWMDQSQVAAMSCR